MMFWVDGYNGNLGYLYIDNYVWMLHFFYDTNSQ